MIQIRFLGYDLSPLLSKRTPRGTVTMSLRKCRALSMMTGYGYRQLPLHRHDQADDK
jgi:hypothetical protein